MATRGGKNESNGEHLTAMAGASYCDNTKGPGVKASYGTADQMAGYTLYWSRMLISLQKTTKKVIDIQMKK